MNETNIIDRTYGKLDEVKTFAATNPKSETLDRCFNTLERLRNNKHGVMVYDDWAPHSLFFAVVDKDMQPAGMHGEIIYHGSSVGWSVHT